MTHGTVILCTDCDIGTRRHRFYCEYTSAGEKGVSVNSHQNSHDAHQKCQMTSCFCVFLLGLVILDVTLKSQQFVVLHRPFGCFMNPLAKQSRIRCFSEGTVFVVIDCSCPHENSSYQTPSQ